MQRHFEAAYVSHVRKLQSHHPYDEAMSLAVGGSFDLIGRLEADLLQTAGLTSGVSVIDLGCGSGRLAKHLGLRMPNLDYLGIDVVPELIEYARLQSPPHFRFCINTELAIPAQTASIDFIVAFSLFTHLHLAETLAYLQDAKRALKVGGKIVFSFLEACNPSHWPLLEAEAIARRDTPSAPITSFIEMSVAKEIARRLECGLTVIPCEIGQTVISFSA